MTVNNRNVVEEMVVLGSRITFNYSIDELNEPIYDSISFSATPDSEGEVYSETSLSGTYNVNEESVWVDMRPYTDVATDLLKIIITECELIALTLED